MIGMNQQKTQIYPLCIGKLTTLRYIFTKRPFILRTFLEIRKTSHKSTNEVVLIRRCRSTNVILLKNFTQTTIHQIFLQKLRNCLKLEWKRYTNLTRINRVRTVPQSRHLALFSAMVLPHFKHKVMCRQELPYKSDCDPHPIQAGFNCKQFDIMFRSKVSSSFWNRKKMNKFRVSRFSKSNYEDDHRSNWSYNQRLCVEI